MSLVWFEGFETCGDEIGSANAATVRPNIDNRVEIATGTGTGDVWLVTNNDADGFALSLGSANNNKATRQLDGTSLEGIPTGAAAPIITVGGRIHVPDDPVSFNAMNIVFDDGAGGSLLALRTRIVNSADLVLRLNSVNVATVTSLFTAGNWAYIELAVRADGGKGNYAVAEVTAEPADDSNTLSITGFKQYLPLWWDQTEYSEGDEVRWMGRAYEAIVTAPATTTGDVPDLNPSIWQDNGPEEDNTSTTSSNFQASFYILEDPVGKQRIIAGSGPTMSTLTLNTEVWDHDSGDYIPQAGDTVIIGVNSFFEVRVEGSTVVRSQLDHGGNGILGFNQKRLNHVVEFSQEAGITGTGEDFVGIDDLYISDTALSDGTTFTYTPDYRGPGKIVSIPPISDETQNWTPSTGTNHFQLVDENGNDDSDYLEAASNGLLDQFGHENSGPFDGIIHAVRIEVEAINTTSGSPTLELSIGANKEITDTVVVDNTVANEVFTLDSGTNPAGGAWQTTDIDALISGIESGGF